MMPLLSGHTGQLDLREKSPSAPGNEPVSSVCVCMKGKLTRTTGGQRALVQAFAAHVYKYCQTRNTRSTSNPKCLTSSVRSDLPLYLPLSLDNSEVCTKCARWHVRATPLKIHFVLGMFHSLPSGRPRVGSRSQRCTRWVGGQA